VSANDTLTRDDVLDNTTLFWLTNSAVSASRLYWEPVERKTSFFAPKNVTIPVAVSAFPDELYQTPRSWAERAYPKLIHYNQLDNPRATRQMQQKRPHRSLIGDMRLARWDVSCTESPKERMQ
jgi:hypothetical protein